MIFEGAVLVVSAATSAVVVVAVIVVYSSSLSLLSTWAAISVVIVLGVFGKRFSAV